MAFFHAFVTLVLVNVSEFVPEERLPWIAWVGVPALIYVLIFLTGGFVIQMLRGTREAHVLDGIYLVYPLSFVVFPVSSVLLLSRVFPFFLREKKSFTWIVKAFFAGILLQSCLVVFVGAIRSIPSVVGSASQDGVLETLGVILLESMFSGLIGVLILIPAVLVQVVYVGVSIILFKTRRLPR